MKFIVLMMSLMAFNGLNAATANCVVFAPGYEEFEIGSKRDTICQEVAKTVESLHYDPIYYDIEVLGSSGKSLELAVIVAGQRYVKNFTGTLLLSDSESFILD